MASVETTVRKHKLVYFATKQRVNCTFIGKGSSKTRGLFSLNESISYATRQYNVSVVSVTKQRSRPLFVWPTANIVFAFVYLLFVGVFACLGYFKWYKSEINRVKLWILLYFVALTKTQLITSLLDLFSSTRFYFGVYLLILNLLNLYFRIFMS